MTDIQNKMEARPRSKAPNKRNPTQEKQLALPVEHTTGSSATVDNSVNKPPQNISFQSVTCTETGDPSKNKLHFVYAVQNDESLTHFDPDFVSKFSSITEERHLNLHKVMRTLLGNSTNAA